MTETASFWASAKSASMSTFIYSLLLTPFDVVKNTQISAFIRKNPYQTARILVKDSGFKTLWRGLLSASISTFTSNIIYYPCYEATKKSLQPLNETWGPGLAAVLSRTLAVFITLPVERLRTSIQGTGEGRLELALKGLRVTLQRDIIFSFMYFMIWENLYKAIKPYEIRFDRTFAILVGSFSAAFITHPFDVIKTKIQTRYEIFARFDKNTSLAIKEIFQKEGVSGLYVGSQARISKIVIGLMIYTNLYEFIKKFTESSKD